MLRHTGIGEIIVFRCWDGDGLAPIEIDADSLREFTELSAMAAAGGWPMHVHAILDGTRERDPRRVGGGRPHAPDRWPALLPRARRGDQRAHDGARPRARPRSGAAGPHADARVGVRSRLGRAGGRAGATAAADAGARLSARRGHRRDRRQLDQPLAVAVVARQREDVRRPAPRRRAPSHARAGAGPLHARQRVVLIRGARARRLWRRARSPTSRCSTRITSASTKTRCRTCARS